MSWIIDKTFEFEYSHRVWAQQLNKEYSVDDKCICRFLHGHHAKVHIFLESIQLDNQSMVTDFKHLNWLKQFFDKYLDHKFICDVNDPYLSKWMEPLFGNELPQYVPVIVPNTVMVAGHTLNLSTVAQNTADYEIGESFVLVNFIPTSENLAKWFYDITSFKMANLGVKVSRVDFWETPKSRSSYRGGYVSK